MNNVILYSKNHYIHSNDKFSDIVKCLNADGYDVGIVDRHKISYIILKFTTKIMKKEPYVIQDFIINMNPKYHPHEDYYSIILNVCLNELRYNEFENLPEPNINVLPI